MAVVLCRSAADKEQAAGFVLWPGARAGAASKRVGDSAEPEEATGPGACERASGGQGAGLAIGVWLMEFARWWTGCAVPPRLLFFRFEGGPL